MLVQETTALLSARLRNALRTPPGDGGDLALTAALRGRHPADIADAMRELARPEALAVFNWLDNARAAEVLDEVGPDLSAYLVEIAAPEQAEEMLARLEERAPEDAAEIRELLSYAERTAGRLMTDKFVRLRGSLTVDEAFAAIRRSGPDVETLNDLYVVSGPSGEERLVGVLSLRDLVRARPSQKVSDVMVRDPIAVTVDTDQEEVARVIRKYDFLALPVLGRDGELAGIVTVDDVVDVLVQEQTEDVLKQSAISAEPGVLDKPYFSVPIWTAVRSRVGWLALLFAASLITSDILRRNEAELDKVTALSFFIPLLIGTGGNTGAQTVSTIIRGLSLGEIRPRDAGRVLMREAGAGILLGTILSVVAFGRVLLGHNPPIFALVVSLSVLGICLWANLVGALIPILAKRLKIDPALVSAPLITTLVDASGLAIYLYIAKLLLLELR